MSDKKIIAVAGATGAQGGGLVRAIQADKDGPFRARAITRNPDSDAAQALAALGAEVVQGDQNGDDGDNHQQFDQRESAPPEIIPTAVTHRSLHRRKATIGDGDRRSTARARQSQPRRSDPVRALR